MDNVALSRRNHTSKKANKENTKPVTKPLVQKDKVSAAPLLPKGNKKETTDDPSKAKVKQADLRSVSGVAQKKVKPAQRDADVPRQTHSQAFRTEQAAKLKKVATEAPKPPAALPPVKSAPGMYKGRIVQSKIGSIWKSSSTLSVPDLKPSAALTESRRAGTMKSRSKSVSEASERETRKGAPTRSKSACDRNAKASAGSRPPTRTVPATLAATSSRNTTVVPKSTTVVPRNTTVVPSKAGGSQSAKPKVSVTDKKVSKPPVSSTLSQYRLTTETAEERRAKLSEWLASKGKTLKRPAMTAAAAAPSNTKTNAKVDLKAQSRSEAPRREPAPERSLDAHKPDMAAQVAEPSMHSPTSLIVNTSLELLENSDPYLSVSPQEEMDDIVVNLCDALEAMATPSGCTDENIQVMDECSEAEGEGKKEEMSEEVVEEEERDVQEVKREEEEEECEDEGVMKTPEAEDASVIKYSVKTTPYLQSFKKTLEDEASASTSKKKSNIKDLKFLTPVRRSCRIERKSSRLPSALVERDPCVSSLAELVKLDGDAANAYIYRKNTALLEGLPDQPRI